MVKCLENLVTLYRTLITLCGTLIVVGVGYHPRILGQPTEAEIKALSDKLDFFGLKFPVAGILNVGCILIIAILVMMINSTRTSRRLPLKEPADAGVWFGQFLGPTGWLPFVTFIILPFVAIGAAQTALYLRPPVGPNASFFPDFVESHIPFLVLIILGLILSSWLWWKNLQLALQWRDKLKPSDAFFGEPEVKTSPRSKPARGYTFVRQR
jgi:hypothetical protein